MESEGDIATSGSNATDGWSRDSGAWAWASYPVGQPGANLQKNGPADQFERAGLEAVAKNPRKPYTGIITENDRHFFKAIFADRAVSVACVECHNSHELSTKRDYKLYDVMGGIIISFPVQ